MWNKIFDVYFFEEYYMEYVKLIRYDYLLDYIVLKSFD